MSNVIEIFTQEMFSTLRSHLLGNPKGQEEAAALIAGIVETKRQLRLLVREVVPIPDEYVLHKSSVGLQIHPDFLSRQLKECRLSGSAFMLAHSHPLGSRHVQFSGVDDAGEEALFPKILSLNEGLPVGSIVMSPKSLSARVWLPSENRPRPVDEVRVLGQTIERFNGTNGGRLPEYPVEPLDQELYSRHVLAIGAEGQRMIQRTRVGIAGVGGVGSSIFTQLMHLGIRDIVLVDPDLVGESNLARMMGTVKSDIGAPKVEVLGKLGLRFDSRLAIDIINEPVESKGARTKLRDTDAVFCCVDSLPSRAFVNRFGCQYYIPVIDVGCDIQMSEKHRPRVRAIGGRVMVLMPDGPCLHRYGMAADSLPSDEQAVDGHQPASGTQVEVPSMVCHIGVVASLAVCEFVNLVTGMASRTLRSRGMYRMYDGISGTVRECRGARDSDCLACGAQRGLGDSSDGCASGRRFEPVQSGDCRVR